jgi:hypothetical protein
MMQRGGPAGTLAAIQKAAAGADALRQRLRSQLPEALREHVASVIIRPGEVVVFADSAAWGSRIKLALAESRPDLAPEAAVTDRISVKMMPTGEFRR